jgi:hypothetical protein
MADQIQSILQEVRHTGTKVSIAEILAKNQWLMEYQN